VVPPKIDVVQSGWSTRTYQYGGTGVSWGAILANRSQTQDALDVQVPCNFVMAANRLIGSSSVHISDLAAGTSPPTGGQLTFPEGAPVARLEHPRRRHGHPGRDPAAGSSGGDEDHDGHASDPDEQSGFGPRRRQSEVQALLVFAKMRPCRGRSRNACSTCSSQRSCCSSSRRSSSPSSSPTASARSTASRVSRGVARSGC